MGSRRRALEREVEPDIGVVIADDATERPAASPGAEGWREALVVMDPNRREAAGSRVAQALREARSAVSELVFPDRSGLLAELEVVASVRSRLADDAELVPSALV